MSNDPKSRLTGNDHEHPTPRGSDASAPRPTGPTKLRRWSVAELIAQAVPRPPAGGLAH